MSAAAGFGRRHPKAVYIAKLGVGVLLLVALCFWRNTGRDAARVLAQFQWKYVILLLVVAQALNLISCVKWQLFLRHQGARVSLWRLWGLYLIGRFFSNFLPSMVGGDLTRMVILGRDIGSQSRSAASVFGERFTGLIAMIGVAMAFSVVTPGIYGEPLVCVALAMSLAGMVVILALVRWPSWLERLARWLDRLPGGRRIGALSLSIHAEIASLFAEHGLMARTLSWSVAFHVMAGLFTYVACISVGFHPPLLSVIVVTPIVLMLNNLPVSPNNVGWWEWSFSVMLAQVGGEPAQGLSVALVLRAVSLVSSLIGGVWFAVERPRLKEAERAAASQGERQGEA